jgi:signal transduction histidine kinase
MSPDPRRASGLLWQVGIALAILTAVFALFNALVVIGLYSHDRPQLARDVVSLEAGRILRDLDAARAPAAPDHVLAWHWEVRKPDGQLIASGGDPGLAGDRPFDPAAWTRWRPDPSGPWISGSTSLSRNGEPVWVTLWIRARSVAVFDRAIRMELLEHVAAPLAPLTLMLLLAALLQVRRLTAPLRTAAREADSLDPDQLGARLTVPATSLEVQRLVQAFNRTLDRVEASIRLVRDFNANAAHELRTPLAVMSLAIDGLPPSELRDTLGRETEVLSRSVRQMLDLAQVDAMPSRQTGRVDLRDIARDQVSQLVRLAWAQDRDLKLQASETVVVDGHAEAIGRALRNLIENGLRHTAKDTAVEVTVGPGPQIRVSDHGPGIPEDQKARLFDRFWRGDRSRNDGAGLGLSIVQAIMKAHGGEVLLETPEDGGAVFALVFPPAGLLPVSAA